MSRVRIFRLVSVVLIAVLLFGQLPPPVAPVANAARGALDPSAAAQVRVVAPATPVPAGQTFSVSLAVAGLDAPLSAFQLDLAYDPAVLEYVGASAGSFLSSTGRMLVCPPPVKAGGTVRLACASTGPAQGPGGDGTLTILTFRAREEGESDLVLSGVQLPDGGRPPALIPATLQDGHVTVGVGDAHHVYLPVVVRGFPPTASPAAPPRPSLEGLGAATTSQPYPSLIHAGLTFGNGYWADVDGDRDVDVVDLQIVAASWDCTSGQPCYDAAHDRDGDGDVDALDLAHFGNEYDVEPPAIAISNPAEGSTVGASPLLVTGTVSDTHAVTLVTVNGANALVTGDAFEAQVTLDAGNQVLTVVAEDELGAAGTLDRVVGVDTDGPRIDVLAPRNRQSVYTLTPSLEIHYEDYYSAVDTDTLSMLLRAGGGEPVDVTGDLVVEADRAYGALSAPLQEGTVYSLTISLQDTLANGTTVHTAFYVPLGAGEITPPEEPEDAGWVSGVIYDSSTCDQHLTQCQGLAGVQVTLAQVDGAALQAARAARQAEILARLAHAEAFAPLAPSEAVDVTTPLSGTAVTGPDGFFAFPVADTDRYWLRAVLEGYTYGQREAEIVRERSTATNAIYLTPVDPAETACDSDGCAHSSADGLVQVDIPAGAIPAGEVVTTTATNFQQVEFLPSGELPPGTQETYAFNLGGDSEYQFQEPVTVRIQNTLGFAPGTEIPLGYWNDDTMAWEHAGTGIVDTSGEWVEMEVTHFSNYDCNDPVVTGEAGGNGDDMDDDDGDCGAQEGSCVVTLRSGHLREEIELPPVPVLGDAVAPKLLYSSNRASPSRVIDVELTVAPEQGVTLGSYVGFTLFIEGQKTDSLFIANAIQEGEVGRYRYLWDGRDAQGRPLPPGLYEYRVELTIPYQAEYCYAMGGIFGNPPDCINGATGRFVETQDEVWVEGTVELDTQVEGPLGTGWVLDGLQRLYEDEAGRILVADGENLIEYYSPGKDLLAAYNAGTDEEAVRGSEELAPYTLVEELPAEGQIEIEMPPAPVAAPETPPPADLTLYEGEADLLNQPSYYSADGEVGGQIISDTVWTVTASPYHVTSDVTVMDGVTLTVEPGVRVLFDEYVGLRAFGNLVAAGTASEPITFTAAVSDTHWGQLRIGGGSVFTDSERSRLSHVSIENAGSPGLHIDHSTPAMDHLSIRGSSGDGIYSYYGGPFVIDTATIEDNGGDGLRFQSGDAGQTLDSVTVRDNGGDGLDLNYIGAITITSSTFSGNSLYGAYVRNSVIGLSLHDSQITSNGAAARLPPGSWLENNTWAGNARNEIEWLGGAVGSDQTWIQRSGGLDTYRVLQEITAVDGVTLTVGAGVEVLFEASAGLSVRGNLVAVGSASAPITFTAAVSGTHWGQLQIGGGSVFTDSERSWLSYVTIERAGSTGLHIDRCTPTMDHLTVRGSSGDGLYANIPGPFTLETATIEDNAGCGVRLQSGAGGQVLTGLTVQHNGSDGLYWLIPGPFTLEDTTIEDNDGDGIRLSAGFGGQALIGLEVRDNAGDGVEIDHAGPITITEATLAGNGLYGINVRNSSNDLLLRDSLVSGNSIAACLPPHARLENNLWYGHTYGEIHWLGGTIVDDRSWLRLPSGIDTYRILGDVTVADAVTLTIGGGVDVLLVPNANLLVNGALSAVGTIDAPIAFGPVSADSTWGSIRIGGGSILTDSDSSHLSFVTIQGGGHGLTSLYVDRSAPTLEHLTIRDSAAHGLYVQDSRNLEIRLSNFINNADHGLYNATPTRVVTATYNYWGAASGPYHPTANPDGEGNPVSDGVLFDPWLGEQVSDLGVSNVTATDNTELLYDPDNGTYTRLYPDGTRVHFDQDGFHDYTLDRLGTRTAYGYHPDGSLATITVTPAGASSPPWTWSFDYSDGRLAAISDPAGRVTTFTIDTHNHLTSVAFRGGESRAFAYDEQGVMTQQADQSGHVTSYSYDGFGRIERVTYPLREVYNPDSGQVELAREVKEFTPSDTAYPLLNDVQDSSPDDPAPAVPLSVDLVAAVDYGRGGRSGHTNRYGYWLDETDGLGRTTTYDRDGRNRVTRETYPDGDCVEYSYDARDNVLSEARMGAAQCALDPGERDPALVQTWTYSYEERFSQIKTDTDPLGNTTTYVFDYEEDAGDAGNRIRIEYPPVQDEYGVTVTPTVQYSYNDWGLLETETDERGTVTRYVYTQGTPDEASDGANPLFLPGVTPVPGLLTQRIEDYGDEAHLNMTATYKDFDAAGNPATVLGPGWVGGMTRAASCSTCAAAEGAQDAEGAFTHYTYDSWGRVLTEENALGIVTRYEYDGRGNRVERIQDYTSDGTTGRNVVTEYTYNAHDQLLSECTTADGIVQETTNTYDVNRMLAIQSDANGNATIYDYDDADQLVSATDPLGYVTTYSYTLKGQQATVTQPDEDTTRTLFDPFGHRVQVIVEEGGLNLATSYTYDLKGNLLAETDPEGASTCYAYDALGRRTSETHDCGGLNLSETYAYDAGDNRVRTTDERGVVTLHSYDALGRLLSARLDAGGLDLEMTYTYDAAGNLPSSTDERGTVTTYEYDALNRVTAMHEDVGGLALTTTYGYGRLGNDHLLTRPDGTLRLIERNAFGEPVREVDDYGGLATETRYAYDNNLNLLSITDANGNMTEYSYDGRDQRTRVLYADGSALDYGYHPDGTLAWRIDQAGQRIDYTYDGADRLIGKSYPDGSSQSLTYDAAGRQTGAGQTMNGHTTQVTLAYNALGDVVSSVQAVDGQGWTTTYIYDYPAGTTTITYSSETEVVEMLDPLGRLSQMAQDGAPLATYTYDDAAGTAVLAHANGVLTTVETDAVRRITRVSSVVADYRYGYDQASNPIYLQHWHESGHPADVYQYDTLGQLVQVWYGADATELGAITSYEQLQRYDLDSLGNRLEVQNNGDAEVYLPNNGLHLTNPMNRYEQVDSSTFSYDAKGNLTGDGINSYAYDYENRQIGMSGPGGTAEYLYDALGRRVAKIVDGVATYYVYDTHFQVIEERDGSNQLLARYTYGAGIDELLTMERGGATYTYHRDALGSITEVTAESGVLVEHYTYDVYGTPRIFDGAGIMLIASTIGNPYMFTGRRYDTESAKYYYRRRMYSPREGRFLQMDPLRIANGTNENLYEYAASSPQRFIDPLGLFPAPMPDPPPRDWCPKGTWKFVDQYWFSHETSYCCKRWCGLCMKDCYRCTYQRTVIWQCSSIPELVKETVSHKTINDICHVFG